MCGTFIIFIFLLIKKKKKYIYQKTFYSLVWFKDIACTRRFLLVFGLIKRGGNGNTRAVCAVPGEVSAKTSTKGSVFCSLLQTSTECSFISLYHVESLCQVAYTKTTNFFIVTTFCDTVSWSFWSCNIALVVMKTCFVYYIQIVQITS